MREASGAGAGSPGANGVAVPGRQSPSPRTLEEHAAMIERAKEKVRTLEADGQQERLSAELDALRARSPLQSRGSSSPLRSPRVSLPEARDFYLPKFVRDIPVLVPVGSNEWRVDNDILRSTAPGIGFRKSKDYEDKVDGFSIEWGETVRGIDAGDDWVRCHVALPPQVTGKEPMTPTTNDPPESNRAMQRLKLLLQVDELQGKVKALEAEAAEAERARKAQDEELRKARAEAAEWKAKAEAKMKENDLLRAAAKGLQAESVGNGCSHSGSVVPASEVDQAKLEKLAAEVLRLRSLVLEYESVRAPQNGQEEKATDAGRNAPTPLSTTPEVMLLQRTSSPSPSRVRLDPQGKVVVVQGTSPLPLVAQMAGTSSPVTSPVTSPIRLRPGACSPEVMFLQGSGSVRNPTPRTTYTVQTTPLRTRYGTPTGTSVAAAEMKRAEAPRLQMTPVRFRSDSSVMSNAAAEGEPCTSRWPVVGDRVRYSRGTVYTQLDGWELPPGAFATVTQVDKDGDFKLRNPKGVESPEWTYRKAWVYEARGLVPSASQKILLQPTRMVAPAVYCRPGTSSGGTTPSARTPGSATPVGVISEGHMHERIKTPTE